jgi:hypothetical protein
MALTFHEPDLWSAPLMRVDVKTGVAPYATGATALDAARAARQLYVDTLERPAD